MSVWDYVEAGIKVFGLNGVDARGNCECGNSECEALYKHPRTSAWQHTPDWSSEQLDVMEMTGQFKTGFGIIVDKLLVIDIDPRNGGDASYDRLCIDTETDYKKESEFVVATGGGGHHIYFTAPEDTRLKGKLDDYPGIDFKYSGFVVGSGSLHRSGNKYTTEKGHPDDIGEMPKVLEALLTRKVFVVDSGATGFTCAQETSNDELKAMLECLSPDCDYETWVSIGMAIHDSTNGEGDLIWMDWSAKGKDYPGNESISQKWHSFGKTASPVTVGTLKKLADEAGYKEPVTFVTDLVINGNEQYDGAPVTDSHVVVATAPVVTAESSEHPVDITGVNLLKCTGLAGDLVDYINNNSRFPREQLAVASALSSLGNVGGISHVDNEYGVTSNQFILCVAGSATGKEAIQQSQAEIHIAAGFGACNFGNIKSEQEITRGLVEHQCNFYVMDELGIFLQKIENARTRGGASYLEGVIGALMSIYSKANKRMPLSSDLISLTVGDLNKRAAFFRKLVSENDNPEVNGAKAEQATALANEIINGGLVRPFLSLIGYTTPVTFNSIVSYENSTNGFIGRSLIFEEKETNPRAKRNFKPQNMSDVLKMRLSVVAGNGVAGVMSDNRIEYRDERTEIKTSAAAAEALEATADFFYEYAEVHKNSTGLEAVVRRGQELILKISMILAIGHDDKTRHVDDVAWAYALVRKDIDHKIKLAKSNMAAESDDKGNALATKLEAMLDRNVEMAQGQINSRCRNDDKNDVIKCLEWLLGNGRVIKSETKHPGNGRVTVKWRLS